MVTQFSLFQRPSNTLLIGIIRSLCLIALVSFATEREASAYTDPGTGALIWQMMLAGLVGTGFYFRKITAWFKNLKGPKS